jgi:hypothetical protein
VIPTRDESRVAWLTGGIGQGKTRLLRHLESAAGAAGRTCVYVPVPTLDPRCITTWCLAQLGLPGGGGSAALHSAARRGFSVLVDDAELLPPESRALLTALAGRADADVRVIFASTADPPEGFSAPGLKLDDERILERSYAALGLDSRASAQRDDILPMPRRQPHARPARAEHTGASTGPGADGDAASAESNVDRESVAAAPTPLHEGMLAAEAGPPRWRAWLAAGAFTLVVGVFVTRLLVPDPEAEPSQPLEPAVMTPVPGATAVRATPNAGASPGSPLAGVQNDEPARPLRPTPVPERVAQTPAPPAEAGGKPPVTARPPGPADGTKETANAMPPATPEAVEPRPEPAPSTIRHREPPVRVGATAGLPPFAAPPPVRPAGRTRVIVNAIPSALVHVDGRFIGETPIAELDLEPGRHRVAAEFEDGTEVVRELEVSGDVMLLVLP